MASLVRLVMDIVRSCLSAVSPTMFAALIGPAVRHGGQLLVAKSARLIANYASLLAS